MDLKCERQVVHILKNEEDIFFIVWFFVMRCYDRWMNCNLFSIIKYSSWSHMSVLKSGHVRVLYPKYLFKLRFLGNISSLISFQTECAINLDHIQLKTLRVSSSYQFILVITCGGKKKYKTVAVYINNKDILNSLNKTQWDVKSCEEQFRLKARHTHTQFMNL